VCGEVVYGRARVSLMEVYVNTCTYTRSHSHLALEHVLRKVVRLPLFILKLYHLSEEYVDLALFHQVPAAAGSRVEVCVSEWVGE
jgi:hypothetical protein